MYECARPLFLFGCIDETHYHSQDAGVFFLFVWLLWWEHLYKAFDISALLNGFCVPLKYAHNLSELGIRHVVFNGIRFTIAAHQTAVIVLTHLYTKNAQYAVNIKSISHIVECEFQICFKQPTFGPFDAKENKAVIEWVLWHTVYFWRRFYLIKLLLVLKNAADNMSVWYYRGCRNLKHHHSSSTLLLQHGCVFILIKLVCLKH